MSRRSPVVSRNSGERLLVYRAEKVFFEPMPPNAEQLLTARENQITTAFDTFALR